MNNALYYEESYEESAEMCHAQAPYTCLPHHQSHEHWHRAPQPPVAFIPSPATLSGPLHHCYKTKPQPCLISSARETLVPAIETFCLWHPCSPSLTPSAARLFCPPCLTHKLPLLSNYNLNFPFTLLG